MPPKKPRPEGITQGLIDDVLELRSTPLSEFMLADIDREGVIWTTHTDAIDAVLDILVPAMRRMNEIEQQRIHSDVVCVSRNTVGEIIGRVPSRSARR